MKQRGIYTSWEDCQNALKRCVPPGHSFASFKTLSEGKEALRCGTLQAYKEKKANTKLWSIGPKIVTLPCLVVDAACSGAPGPVEYRGVVLPEGFEAFRKGPFTGGTNNIGEYLAIVTGLRWLEERSLTFPLYSDSAVAIGWIKTHGRCNSHISEDDLGQELETLIKSAESWMRLVSSTKMVERVVKWETDKWGEIPADYDRK